MDDEKQDVTIDLLTALDMENEAVKERASEIETNQKLGLLIGCLSVNDWYHAQILLDRLSHLNPVEHIQICESLFRLIEKTMSTAYNAVCRNNFRSAGTLMATSSGTVDSTVVCSEQKISVDLPKEFFQMLTACGPFLYRNPVLLQKVCIVLRAHYVSAQESGHSFLFAMSSESNDVKGRDPRLQLKEARFRLEEALGACLLPSLQLIPANPAVVQEIWDILCLLPYEVRYRLYGEWERDDETLPMILAARQTVKLDTRRLLKRLAKENLKQLGRMVAKLSHANPMTVLRTIVHQIEAYRDMIAPVVDAFKYLTQLEYDILEYVVIERLAQGGREKLKDDGLNLSDWLQSLAFFWGHLCKKYPSMELRGLFQYLVNQLKRGSGIELVVLQELIQQMANVQYTENMTEDQLEAMAGSETLRYQATQLGLTRNNKQSLSKSMNRLRDALLPKEEAKLAIPLLLLIAQHRSMIIRNADAPYIKMVSEQFDRCHGTFLQYVEFLYSAVTPTTSYAQFIPPLDELVHHYHLEPEVAFLVYRPVMRLFKKNDGSEICWPLDIIEQHNAPIADAKIEQPIEYCDVSLDPDLMQKPVIWSDLLEVVRSMLPSKTWNSLSPELYTTFWGLTLYDLYVPKTRYEAEITKQHAAIKALEEFSDNSSMAITKRKKEKERIQEILERLKSEVLKHEQHVASVRLRLTREKDKWLSSCPDTLKTNMEFLQRCIFPRCTFSMQDAVYCAEFVHTLHSLGTPYFNTVNHLDILICRTLQPMICCCTEYEAGRLGRFLYETLKMAYHWKSDESIYERECGNMPGFAVYYRFPNSQRVAYNQFIKVHWKWSGRITRLLVQCLESSEYMEIRNALIVLTKISGVFPVIRKSGINLEKRVAKIKGDEREDLKVLATGVAAALAARKSSWVSEEDFTMGYVELKPAASPAKLAVGNQASDPLNSVKELAVRAKPTSDRTDGATTAKPELSQQKMKAGSTANGSDNQASGPAAIGKFSGAIKNIDETAKNSSEEAGVKVVTKVTDPETRSQQKRAGQNSKLSKMDGIKEDNKSGKAISRSLGQQPSVSTERDVPNHQLDNRQTLAVTASSSANGNMASGKTSNVSTKMADDLHSNIPKIESGGMRPSDDSSESSDLVNKQQKRYSLEEQERVNKRRKGESDGKDGEGNDVRLSDKERNYDKPNFSEHEKNIIGEQNINRPAEKAKTGERYDKDHKEKLDRADKNHGEDIVEKSRDRSLERYGRERSAERMQERGADRNKDDRSKPRHSDASIDKSHPEERFHGQSLPPPPPLPHSFVPQSVGGSRRDDEVDRRNARHIQRLSPRHDEKERRRSEENALVSQDDAKRRREDDFRERKHDERDGLSNKADERDRDKASMMKEDVDQNTGSKRRRIKKEHSPVIPPPPPPREVGLSQPFDTRERSERKGVVAQHRAAYIEEALRAQGKDTAAKMNRRETDQMHEREWEEDKRQRNEAKRKHRK